MGTSRSGAKRRPNSARLGIRQKKPLHTEDEKSDNKKQENAKDATLESSKNIPDHTGTS